MQPPVPTREDVRSAVDDAIEEARRLPPMPLMPIDYSALLADIHRWIEALQGAQADVDAAAAEAAAATAANGAKAEAADVSEGEAWHRLAWLSEQLPLVEGRLGDVGGKLAPAAPAVAELQALVQRIETDEARRGAVGAAGPAGRACSECWAGRQAADLRHSPSWQAAVSPAAALPPATCPRSRRWRRPLPRATRR